LRKLILLIFLACLARTAPQLDLARKAEIAGNLAAAEAAYEEELKKRPSADTWQRLGLVRHLQNKFESAIPAFRSAVDRNPSLWTSHLFLGICLYRTNRFEEAESALRKANRLAPLQHQGRDELEFWLGATLIARQQSLAGLYWLERLLVRNAKHAGALELATRTYTETASGLWNDVAERHFETPAGWEVHGYAMESEGNLPRAVDAFLQSQTLAPRRAGPGLAIGRLLLREGKAKEAFDILQAEMKLSGSAPETGFHAGLAAIQLEDYAAAVPALNAAEKGLRRNPEIPLALAQVQLALARPQEAAEAAKRAVALAPQSAAAHELLLAALQKAGLDDDASKERERWEGISRQP